MHKIAGFQKEFSLFSRRYRSFGIFFPWLVPKWTHIYPTFAHQEVVVATHSTSGQTPMAVVPEETEKENEKQEVPQSVG